MKPIILQAIAVLMLIGTAVLCYAAYSSFSTVPAPAANISAIFTPEPTPAPIHLATPRPYVPPPTPTPEPPPAPTALPPRWCDSGGCHWGIPPTPVPMPTVTPTPIPTPTAEPLWAGMGFKCYVPDRLVNAHGSLIYKFDCACQIREKYQLGDDFNPCVDQFLAVG